MLRRARCTLVLAALTLAGCAASDHVAPSPILRAPDSPLKTVTPSQFRLGAIVNQDLAEIWVGNVETIGFGTTQDGIVDCGEGFTGLMGCGNTAVNWVLQICEAFYGCNDESVGPCGFIAGYPLSNSNCYRVGLDVIKFNLLPSGTHTFWARARTAATTQGRSPTSSPRGQPNGIFYVFDHWISTTPCIEGTQTGLTCSFTFTATVSETGRNMDWGSVPVYRAVDYSFGGFLQPVSSSDVNIAKAGSGVPIKFSLGGAFGLNVLAAGSPNSKQIACQTNTPTSSVAETSTAGSSGLSYDATTDLYTYVWKTDKAWTDTCRQFTLTLLDGEAFSATFQFIK
jgi:hypothetical protein